MFSCINIKNKNLSEEMSKQLRKMASLPEDLGSILSTHVGAYNFLYFLFWPCEHQIWMWYIEMPSGKTNMQLSENKLKIK